MEQAVKILRHNLKRALAEDQTEKNRCAPDEIGAAQNSFDPLSKKRNEGELETPHEQSTMTREEKRERQKQDSKLAQTIRLLTKDFMNKNNKDMLLGIDKYLKEITDVKFQLDQPRPRCQTSA